MKQIFFFLDGGHPKSFSKPNQPGLTQDVKPAGRSGHCMVFFPSAEALFKHDRLLGKQWKPFRVFFVYGRVRRGRCRARPSFHFRGPLAASRHRLRTRVCPSRRSTDRIIDKKNCFEY